MPIPSHHKQGQITKPETRQKEHTFRHTRGTRPPRPVRRIQEKKGRTTQGTLHQNTQEWRKHYYSITHIEKLSALTIFAEYSFLRLLFHVAHNPPFRGILCFGTNLIIFASLIYQLKNIKSWQQMQFNSQSLVSTNKFS